MTEPPLRALLVDDDDAYAALVAAELEAAATDVSLCRVSTLRAAATALSESSFDVIVLDVGLPDSQGAETIDRAHAMAPEIPIVVLTAHDDEAFAAQSVHRGAEDYLVKGAGDHAALPRAIRYAHERASLRRELREREMRFRALVEHSVDAVMLVDPARVVHYCSRSIVSVSGYEPAEVEGQSLDVFAHPDEKPEVVRALGEAVDNPGRAVMLSSRYRHKDGTWHWGEAVAVNRLDDPAVRAIVVNLRDVSTRTLAEQELRLSHEKLRQAHKMEAIGRLAGGVAHDFNNVLTAILGYTELLFDQFAEGDPRRADLEEIRRSADRAAGLTRQLLAFSRNQIMQPRVLDLNTVVRDITRLLERLVREDIIVEITTAPDLWRVCADPGQIEQVLMNLAANGRDAMPDGGRLMVTTANAVMSDVEVEELPGLKPGAYVTLEVSDTGEGIPEELRVRVFEPFFTTKEQGKGTGLGLATVYGIVKQTGGGIYLTSEEKKGTRFMIYLPRVP